MLASSRCLQLPDRFRIHEWSIMNDVKANPDENPKELLARLRSRVSDALTGTRWSCGAPIWVVGSVSAGD